MWRLIVAAWAPARSKSTITRVIGVPAFRCSAIIGTVTPGDGPAISAISCVCTTSSPRKRSGNAYELDGKHKQTAGIGRGGGVAGGGPISRLCLPALLSLLARDCP